MCRVLSVPISRYYGGLKRPHSKRAVNHIALTAKINDRFETEKRRSGAIRITKPLQESVEVNDLRLLMLNGIEMTETDYSEFHQQLKDYRDRNLIQREHDPKKINDRDLNYPELDPLIKSLMFACKLLVKLIKDYPS